MIAHSELVAWLSSHRTCFSCVCCSRDTLTQAEPHEKSGKMLLVKRNANSAFLGTIFNTVLFMKSIFPIYEDVSHRENLLY